MRSHRERARVEKSVLAQALGSPHGLEVREVRRAAEETDGAAGHGGQFGEGVGVDIERIERQRGTQEVQSLGGETCLFFAVKPVRKPLFPPLQDYGL